MLLHGINASSSKYISNSPACQCRYHRVSRYVSILTDLPVNANHASFAIIGRPRVSLTLRGGRRNVGPWSRPLGTRRDYEYSPHTTVLFIDGRCRLSSRRQRQPNAARMSPNIMPQHPRTVVRSCQYARKYDAYAIGPKLRAVRHLCTPTNTPHKHSTVSAPQRDVAPRRIVIYQDGKKGLREDQTLTGMA